jgi:hypothetical protein
VSEPQSARRNFCQVKRAHKISSTSSPAPIDLSSATDDNRFATMLAYLSGSIEYSPDRGKIWRAALTPFLRSLGHDVYDPAEDEKKNLTEVERLDFRAWKHSDLPRFQQTMREIIAYDLDWIEHRADYVVAYWDEYASRGAGSQAELSFAHRRGIPVYLVTELPVGSVSGWILGCASEVFSSFEELKQFMMLRYPATDKKEVVRRFAQSARIP